MPARACPDASHTGTNLKTFFTIRARARYGSAMLWLATAALAASAPQGATTSAVSASAQARAMVRVVSGVTLRLTGEPSAGAPRPRTAIVRTDGQPKRVRLIEFE